MNFASYDFWKFLILCFVGSRLILATVRSIRPQAESTAAKLCLLATALILLSSESGLTLAAFLWVVILGWLCVLLQAMRWPVRVKHTAFLLLLAAQLAPLFYFKYWNFALNEVLGLDVRIPSVLIPMGLSFYTFQTVGFWIDNLRDPKPRPSFLDYLNFSSFFPQIVAGPIEKRESLLPQIQTIRFHIHRANLESALQWIILGLAYKLIVADNLGGLSDNYQISATNAWHVWLECLVFGFRIYFDFAGYSFIAVGLGLLFGVHLTLNFRCPYWSLDLREFWRNWHVTLGSWLRDYIYLPLGGKRVKWWAVNTIIVFLVSGIWHGAGWGFLIWGLLHGIGVAVCALRPGLLRFNPLRWAVTFAYTIAAWLFFLERDPALLREKALSMVQPAAYSLDQLRLLAAAFPGPTNAITTAIILCLAAAALALEGWGVRRRLEPYHLTRHPAASLILVFLTVLLAPMEESSFIYFNF
jgi:D-alanyl-lipoteichoic acid acyltransferase DltB (MBOAT superfamily)